MSDLMPCPSCQATLRIPAGAEAIRCPQCKTVVNLKNQAAPPQAPPIPKAIPLPFDRPAPPPVPVAKAKPIEKPMVRGKVVRDEDEDRDDEERDRKPRKPVVERPDYGDLEDECKFGRVAVQLLGASALCGGAMALGFAAFLGTLAVASSVIMSLYYLVIALMVIQALLFIVGFGFAVAGPREMRPTAIVGLLITMLHIGVALPIVFYGVNLSENLSEEGKAKHELSLANCIFFMGAGPSNLCGLTDIPWLLVQGELEKPWYVVGIVIGAFLEFWRASIFGTLIQYYAAEGKSVELGFRSLRFVYRIIWVVMIGLGLKVLVLFLMRMFGGENTIATSFNIPQTLLTDAFYLWWGFTWFAQFQTSKEVVEIVTAPRFADKRQNLDG
ncbi:hypothetical protein BH11PLA2_BH11PLA2_32330 [soil metagenome]